MWSRSAFIRSAGIHHCLFFISISAHAVEDASSGRMRVSSCHSSKQRVGIDKLLIEMVRISLGSSSGRIVGMCCFLGRSKALPMPEAGFASINPTFPAEIIISLMRWANLLTVSNAARALIGSNT